LTRIGPDGKIDDTGNTRRGGNTKEVSRVNGEKKKMIPMQPAFSLEGAAIYFNDKKYKIAADSVVTFYKK
jgi:hypothetical protein